MLVLLALLVACTCQTFEFGAKAIPHPDKMQKGGEDAYLASQHVIAVADGVGSWGDYGVDPGLYSKELCSNIQDLIQQNAQKYMEHPKRLIIDAEHNTQAKGTSTVTVITLSPPTRRLHISQLGDSGYLLLRFVKDHFKLVKLYSDHSHQFNMPYQIGTDGDHPSTALEDSVPVQHNDILVVASDGYRFNHSMLAQFVRQHAYQANHPLHSEPSRQGQPELRRLRSPEAVHSPRLESLFLVHRPPLQVPLHEEGREARFAFQRRQIRRHHRGCRAHPIQERVEE